MVKSLQEEIGKSIRAGEVLRQSGAESVVEARDLERSVPVVLNVLDLEVIGGAELLPSFEREAAKAVGFRHVNIATAQPLERRPSLVFYALNVGYAKSLKAFLAAGPPPSLQRAMAIVRGIAAALDYEHSQGAIHGRLTPDLIFVDEDHVLVSGFGGMRDVEADPGNAPVVYQAPEQSAWRQEIDRRVDVYALGVIAYELLSGKRLQMSESAATSPAEPLRISRGVPLAPGLSLQVNEAILRAVAKRPSQRFATAGEFIRTLESASPEPVEDVPEEALNEEIVVTPEEVWTRLLDGPPREPPPPSVTLPPRLGIRLGIGCLCVVGALTIFSLRKSFSMPRFPPAFVDTLSHLSSPLKAFDNWMAKPQPHQPAPPADSGGASRGPRVSASGVMVENGVLVFPGEKRRDSSGSFRASARHRNTAERAITKPTAH